MEDVILSPDEIGAKNPSASLRTGLGRGPTSDLRPVGVATKGNVFPGLTTNYDHFRKELL
jgi:hypothetical protein